MKKRTRKDAPVMATEAAIEPEPVKATDTIHCRDSGSEIDLKQPWRLDEPVSFQWMPGGTTTINASYNGSPIELTVDCDEETAAAVQASYENWTNKSRQEPFGCCEHREEEAAIRLPKGVASFSWRDEPEQGVYCTAVPTELGARNVNGRIHRSWSPSFTTDADYAKAKLKDGSMCFPAKARGGKDNPARITGIAFSCGSLTNKPAFKNILPVRAKEASQEEKADAVGTDANAVALLNRIEKAETEFRDAIKAHEERLKTLAIHAEQAAPQPETPNAETNKGLKMKVVFIKARDGHAAGATVELEDAKAVQAIASGEARSEADHLTITASEQRLVKQQEAQTKRDEAYITAKIGEAKKRGSIAPKDEAVQAKALEWYKAGGTIEMIGEFIDGLQAQRNPALTNRVTASMDKDGKEFSVLARGDETLSETAEHYVKASEPMTNMIRAGNWKDAIAASKERAVVMQTINAASIKDDFRLSDVVKAADTSDPDSQVGTLATGLVLIRNLGYLVNKLQFLKFISTDLSSEPAQFGQNILTRYITPPGVLTWVPGVGFTSDATTIATSGTGTDQSAGTNQSVPSASNNYLAPVKSVPSTTDKNVIMNQFKATEIEFSVSKLSMTVRNLFGEQRGAQLYSLAENINQHFLSTVFGATWTTTKPTYVKPLADWNLKSFVGVKNAMTISKIPDIGRFILLHSFYYDKTLEDSNLLNASAILSLIKGDASSFNSSELPALFGLKPLESQLAAANAGTLTTWTDETTPPAQVGFAGNMSSALFVSRPPQNYTMIAQQLGIPITASVELVTEPDSGLTVMVFKYVDNGKMAISQRVCLMWGDAQGHPGQGIIIKPA